MYQMKEYKIASIAGGDGIGKEVCTRGNENFKRSCQTTSI